MNFQTYRRIENWLLAFVLGACCYAGYDVYQAFSIWALAKWVGIIFIIFILFGMIIPDWSRLENVRPLFIEISDMLDAKKLAVYARELESARVKLFLERDRTKRALQLLEKVPLETIKREMVETWEAKKAASPEKEEILAQRFQQLEQTLARLRENSQQESRFEEMKKDVMISLQNLRVRLESSDETLMQAGSPSVAESFQQILSVMNRLEKPSPETSQTDSENISLRPSQKDQM